MQNWFRREEKLRNKTILLSVISSSLNGEYKAVSQKRSEQDSSQGWIELTSYLLPFRRN